MQTTYVIKWTIKFPKRFLNFLAKKGFRKIKPLVWRLDTPDQNSADYQLVILNPKFSDNKKSLRVIHEFWGKDCGKEVEAYSTPVYDSCEEFVKKAYL